MLNTLNNLTPDCCPLHRGTMFTLFLCFSMLAYPTATLGAGLSNPKVTRSAVLSLNRGFCRNTASPRCVSLVRRPFLCPLTINPTQQVCHLNHFIVLDLDVAKQTSILRHYSFGNSGREISDHILQGCFWSHQKYCKNPSKGNPRTYKRNSVRIYS